MEPPSGKPKIVTLLVDDDTAYLEVLKFFLEREGSIECRTATSAKEALEMLSEQDLEVVVSDYLMPEMDGIELLKIVRAQGLDLPFILLTARGREDVAIEALNSGADFYVTKGGDPKAQYVDIVNMIRRSALQRRAEKSAMDGERFLRDLFNSVQDGITVLSKDLVIERANPTVERWYRGSMPLIGKKCYEAYRGRTEPCELCPTLRTMQTGRVETERILETGSDEESPGCIDVYSFPVRNDQSGEVERVIEYMRDVTPEEVARRSLSELGMTHDALVRTVREGVLLVDTDGRISFSNQRLAEMLGYSVEEIVGSKVSSLVEGGPLSALTPDEIHSVLEKGDWIQLELVKRDGSKMLASVSASPLSTEGGLAKGAVVVITDRGGARTAMNDITASREKFEKLFQTTPQLIVITRTSDGKIVDVNNSFIAALGFQEDQLLGSGLIELGIVSDKYMSMLDEMLAGEGVIRDLEMSLRASSGEERFVRLSSYRTDIDGQECTVYLCCDVTPRDEGVAELRQERDVLRQILESSPDSIVIADSEGIILEVNTAAMSILGNRSKDELIGKNAFSMLGGEGTNKAKRIAEKLLRERTVRNVPFEMTRADGIAFSAMVSASVVEDSVGSPLYLIGVIQDVTDQVRNKAALERALRDQRQMESIVNKSSAVAFMWAYAPSWPVEYVSDNVSQFGYSSAELTSHVIDYASIVHPEDLELVKDEVEDHIRQGEDEFEQEYRIVSPDGTVFWVFDRTTVIRDARGAVDYLQGVVVDVTERKLVDDRLSRMERQMRLFMDLSPTIKFMKDKEGRYTYVNRTLLDAMNASAPDWIGRTDHEIFPEEVADRVRENDRQVLESGEFKTFVEMIPQEDGPHEYLTYKFLVPSVTDSDDLLAGVSVDMTEQRRYEKALKAANEKLQLLSGITRHDIMNQLAVLVGWMSIVRGGQEGPVAEKGFVNMQRAADTIRELLEFTSDYQDIGVKNPLWMDVEETVSKSLSGLSLEGIQVNVSCKGLQVYSDPMLERVFRNLVDNSVRHGVRVSKITLSCSPDGDDVVLAVEDDGVGISEGDRAHLFERGFGKNTGLGLYMVRQILGLTGMTIEETGREGLGARFEIRVPRGNFRFVPDKG